VIESELLEAHVAPFRAEPDDWPDVLRRARHRPRRRLVLAAAAVLAALAAASAVAVPLLVSQEPRLPAAADRTSVAAAIEPGTGRVVVEVARWREHRGICYLVVGRTGACVPRAAGGVVALSSTFRSSGAGRPSNAGGDSSAWGYTFDRRVVSAKIVFADGTQRALPVHPFGRRLSYVTFVGPARIPKTKAVRGVELYDRAGRVVPQR
jgi:hypothetical protein